MTEHAGLARDTEWFDTVQVNILKSHGRNCHRMVGLRLAGVGEIETLRAWVRRLPVTTFRQQLEMAEDFRQGKSTPPTLSFWLSASGYKALGFGDSQLPLDSAFRGGMCAAGGRLGDPAAESWEEGFRSGLDAVLVAASDDRGELDELVDGLLADLEPVIGAAGSVVVDQRGEVSRSDAGAVDGFGFADGVSNPRFLADHIAAQGPRRHHDERAPKELVLVEDPNAPGAFGSYVVLRKYRQDVQAFDRAEQGLADALGLDGEHRQRAGAMIVGRFRDGTPLISDPKPGLGRLNDFDYVGDPQGARCPLHAHVRKMNDRGESLKKNAWHEESRRRRIVRRGFGFGPRAAATGSAEAERGLVFVSFQASVEQQFEVLQRRFANDPDYFSPDTGADPLIGKEGSGTCPQRWPAKYGDPASLTRHHLTDLVEMRGGEYFFAPSIPFLRRLPGLPARPARGQTSTLRGREIRQRLVDRAFSNRKDEWLTPEMLPHLLVKHPELAAESVIVRKAFACRAMLEALVNPEHSRTTRTFDIEDGELLVGRIPLGSVGLGKTFPGYLTPDEARVASFCNRDEPSVFGHTVPDYQRVVQRGLEALVEEAEQKAASSGISRRQKDFYRSVGVVCRAVVAYAESFGDKAEALAAEAEGNRRQELLEIARVCRKVPAQPAESFHEALQSVWFVHLAQSAFCALDSLGRLDQILAPYYDRGTCSRAEALELVECFLLKGAERLHLDPSALRDADHLSFGTGIGTAPIYLDQVASSNNFIQNIVIGGVDAAGDDATHEVTHLFLEASGGVALCTPTLNVRVHEKTPAALLEAIDTSFRRARTGLPILYNDASIIGGLERSGIPLEDARNYSCAGCWEPVIGGKSTLTFGMVNLLRVMECTLDEGTLMSQGTMFLRGQKQSPRAPHPSTFTSFEALQDELVRQLRFFTDKVALGTCAFYRLAGEVTPTPFLSALTEGCMERGLDQGQGGATYNIAGCLAFAFPNAVNALANIQRFVFEERRFSLAEVAEALRRNWGIAPVRSEYEMASEPDADRIEQMQRIRRAFLDEGETWGNGDPRVEALASWLSDRWLEACDGAKDLARRAFFSASGSDEHEARKLRCMANSPSAPLDAAGPDGPGSHFEFKFTHGSGTFGQYSSMGIGTAASADGRAANEPIAPNCSPPGGTAISGLETFLPSLTGLGLDRFGCGVVTDLRVDGTEQEMGFFARLARRWTKAGGSILTVSCLSTAELETMFLLSEKVRAGLESVEALRPYCDLMCRVGGWNSAYICLPRGQQHDHLLRARW